MTNITMLCATRPRLAKQSIDSLGDITEATVYIRDASLWEPLGTGPARNQVIASSEMTFGRGSHLYLSDDDVYFLQRDWLKVLTTAYDEAWEHGFRVIGGYNHPFNRPFNPIRLEKCRSTVSEVYALASQSMLMRWEVWDEFGPFCDTPAGKVCQSEDVDFSNRVRAAGYKVGVISPPLLVNTGITNSFGEHIPGWELVKSQAPDGVICE